MPPDDNSDSESAFQLERRNYPRSPCQILIQYRSTRQSSWDLTPLKELGCTGARFLADGELDSGEAMDIRIGLPLFSRPIELPARVVWQKSAFSGPFKVSETGIAFTGLDAHLVQTIDDVVQRLLKQSRDKVTHSRLTPWST